MERDYFGHQVIIFRGTIPSEDVIGRASGRIAYPFSIAAIYFALAGGGTENVDVRAFVANDGEETIDYNLAGTEIISGDSQSRNILLTPTNAAFIPFCYPVPDAGKYLKLILAAGTLALTRHWTFHFHIEPLRT